MTLPIQFVCPHCNQQLKVAGATGGKQVRCPQCQGIIHIPNGSRPASGGPTHWVLRTEEGKVYGPVARDELLMWIDEGRVQPNCQISPEGAQHWMWVAEVFPQILQNAAIVAPVDGPVSERSRLTAGLLGLLLPLALIFGVHRLYLGHIWLGILMMVTFGGCGVWQLIDVILIFAGAVKDAEGLTLRE